MLSQIKQFPKICFKPSNTHTWLTHRGEDGFCLMESGYLGPPVFIHDSNASTVSLSLRWKSAEELGEHLIVRQGRR